MGILGYTHLQILQATEFISAQVENIQESLLNKCFSLSVGLLHLLNIGFLVHNTNYFFHIKNNSFGRQIDLKRYK